MKTDILVIGAGPAGSTAAAYLNKKGFDVVVVEKQKFPRFVIGESLLPRCMNHLEDLGFLDVLKKADFQVKKGAIFTWFDKYFDFDFSEQFTQGYSWTWQVQREKFDTVLINEVQQRGVDVRFEEEVTGVDFSSAWKKTEIKSKNGESYSIQSKFILDASGYGRVLPKLLDLNVSSDFETRIASFARLKNHFVSSSQKLDKIIIDTLDDDKTWMWIIPFSDGTTSVGVVGNNKNLQACLNNPKENYPTFVQKGHAFKTVFSKLEYVREPMALQGYSIGVKKMYGDGYALCGNSTEFLDPVFSSGVTFAIESGVKAAELAAKTLNNEIVDWHTAYEVYMQKGIDVFRTYVTRWYDGTLHDIFYAKDVRKEVKDRICSILAGYVWDETNSFVKKHDKSLVNLAKVIKMYS